MVNIPCWGQMENSTNQTINLNQVNITFNSTVTRQGWANLTSVNNSSLLVLFTVIFQYYMRGAKNASHHQLPPSKSSATW